MGSAGRSGPVIATWFQLNRFIGSTVLCHKRDGGFVRLKPLYHGHLPGVKTTCISVGMGSRGRYANSSTTAEFGVEPGRWFFIFWLVTYLKDTVNLQW